MEEYSKHYLLSWLLSDVADYLFLDALKKKDRSNERKHIMQTFKIVSGQVIECSPGLDKE